MAKAKKSDFISTGLVAQNRRAHFDYLIEQKYTAGLELTGTEVKSLRLGHANINDAYGIEKDGELFYFQYVYRRICQQRIFFSSGKTRS